MCVIGRTAVILQHNDKSFVNQDTISISSLKLYSFGMFKYTKEIKSVKKEHFIFIFNTFTEPKRLDVFVGVAFSFVL